MKPEKMTFESRLINPVTITKASVEYMQKDGVAMIATYADPITIDTITPVEVWECECGKHPCVSFWAELGDELSALVTGNLPEGASAIRFASGSRASRQNNPLLSAASGQLSRQ